MAEFFVDRNSACAAWNTAVLKGHCFVSRLDCLHLKNNYAKFQLISIRNDWVMFWLEILQRCMKYCRTETLGLLSMISMTTIVQFALSCRLHRKEKCPYTIAISHLWDTECYVELSTRVNHTFVHLVCYEHVPYPTYRTKIARRMNSKKMKMGRQKKPISQLSRSSLENI